MKNKRTRLLVALVLGLMIFPISALAFEAKTGETVTIGAGEEINDDIFIGGTTIRIDGKVNGDVFAAGSIIEINGEVVGDVVVAGSQVVVRGKVHDDLYAAGGQVTIEEEVGDNAMVAGGTVSILSDVNISRDLWAGAGMLALSGNVGRNVRAGAGTMDLAGNIEGELEGEFDELILESNSRVGGDLKYKSPVEAIIDDDAEVGGAIDYTELKRDKYYPAEKQVTFVGPWPLLLTWILAFVIKMLSLIIVALFVTLVFAKSSKALVQNLQKTAGKSFGWGLVVMILTPLVLLLLLVTIIGAPLALLLGMIYIVFISLAKVLVGIWLGESAIKLFSKKKNVSLVWSAILGVIMLCILFSIPIVGWLIKCVVLMFGIGSIYLSLRAYLEKTNKKGRR